MTNSLPSPPLVYWWKPPSHDGLLDIDVEESNIPTERLDIILWEHHKLYREIAKYIRNCIACRDSARRMGLPYGTKQEWWDFISEANTYIARIESRMMFVLEEMTRRYPKPPEASRPLKKRCHRD